MLAIALALAACARHDTEETGQPGLEVEGGIPYTVSLEGLPSGGDVRDVLEESLRLYTLAGRLPPSLARLRRRAEADVETTLKVLRSEGYYAARASVEVTGPGEGPAAPPPPDSGGEATDAEGGVSGDAEGGTPAPPPARVELRVVPGPRYQMSELLIEAGKLPPDLHLPSAAELGLPAGSPARASAVVEAERQAVLWLQDHGYPYARFVRREAVADPERSRLRVVSEIEPGPRLRFGPLRITGLRSVDADYVETYRKWTPGEYYSASKVTASRQAVQGTGLFEVVQLQPAPRETPAPGEAKPGTVPIEMTVDEAKHRSVGLGVRYATDQGPGANAFVEHRNLLGANETGRLSGTVAADKEEIAATFRKPQYLRPGQALFASAGARNERSDAFDERGVNLSLGVQRKLTDRLEVSVATSFEAASVGGSNRSGDSYLFGLPLGASYDASDDLFDPSRGYRLRAEVTPYGGVFGGDSLFFPVTDLHGSVYFPTGRHVLALRGRLASIVGEPRDAVPPQKRLYAGGGGSVRGYKLRYVGPLDDEGQPIGGRSAAELSVEWRFRVSETIGLVPFVDAGAVSASSLPDLADGVQVAAGLGLRYYTAIGPIRADVAFPLNPREEDPLFQFYVSIGQAF